MPKRHFFSQFLISDEIITYFSFVFVSRIISCLALSSRKSLGREGGFSDPVAAADYVLLCSTYNSFSSLLPSHSGLVILTPQPEAVSLIACSALMRLYEEGKDIEMFGCGVHADWGVCRSEKSPTLVWNSSTAALSKFNAVQCLSAVIVLTLKTTFFSPLSGLISREADGKLICTCSLPAVQILSFMWHVNLAPLHLFKTCKFEQRIW